MKIVGLITEYNPFHNGHQYHLEEALRVTGADAAIVVMSGNYVQRGAPAIMPKHLRAEMALRAGAGVVIELPVSYATGSAEYFARGAVSLLDSLGCVDAICFGTESGSLLPLRQIARILCDEPEAYRDLLRAHLKSGLSFPLARQKAICEYTKDDTLSAVLALPNNILGIEYLKALSVCRSDMVPYAIGRKVSGYHDTELRDSYSSASAIRGTLASEEDALSHLSSQVPPACLHILQECCESRYPVFADDFSLLLRYRLLTLGKEELMEYADVNEELANRILKNRNAFVSFDRFCETLKTRELTYTRISRAMLHILLGIRKESFQEQLSHGMHGYARILGFRTDSSEILTRMKKTSSLPLLTKLTAAEGLEDWAARMLRRDIFAADLYESVITDKFKYPFKNEYEHPVVRI